MATVAIAVVQSTGGLWIRGAIASIGVADQILVIRPRPLLQANPRSCQAPLESGSSGEAAATRVRFVDLEWQQFEAAEKEAYERLTCDWLLVIDEGERIDEELNRSLEYLRREPARRGHFLVCHQLVLFGSSIASGRRKRVVSSAGASESCLGILPGAVRCQGADSVASLIRTIGERSGVLAHLELAAGRRPTLARMAYEPLRGFARAIGEARFRGGVRLLIYAASSGYLAALKLARLWELERVRRLEATLLKREEHPRIGVPEGYVSLASRRTILVVAQGNDDAVKCLEQADPEDCVGEPVPGGGRGAAWIVALNGGAGVLRWYRRGGLVRWILRDCYLNLRGAPRPLEELRSCIEARRRGILVPEVLGVRIDRVIGPIYRGGILTRQVDEALTAWEALLQSSGRDARRRLLCDVLAGVRRMHDEGVYHRDLNLGNVLVRRRDGQHEVWFVDLDRAAVLKRPVGRARRRRALKRMARSLWKLGGGAGEEIRRELPPLAELCLRGQLP